VISSAYPRGIVQLSEDKGITEGQRRAGSGESYVEARLKSFAQVSRPAHLFEYAIDFYCRLLQYGKPSNNIFGVEVKSTNQFNNLYSESIDKETVKFWLTQPFPVFVVVYEDSSDNCYWISVEDNRTKWLSKLQNEKKSVTITIDRSQTLGKNQNVEFIQKIEEDIIRVNAIQGIPQFISRGYEGYAIGHIPILRLSDEARENVRERIRYGFNYLVNDSVLRNDLKNAYSICKLLADFDHGHYDHYLLLARICREVGRKEEARENYKRAIEICEADPNWDKKRLPNAPHIGEIIENIRKESLSLDGVKSN
jgi:tetratricopeptide (TPR) repeat protein